MLFKIISRTDDNQLIEHYYENISQKIYDCNKQLIDLTKNPKFSSLVQKQKFIHYGTKQRKLDLLKIVLGYNCNYHCKYCVQGPQNHPKTIPIKEDYFVKINNLISSLSKLNLEPKRIAIWGGEPFVYWKIWVKLHEKLKELYPNTIFSVITNGSLLTLDKVVWLIENKYRLTVSHDASAFEKLRNDKNPLDNPKVVEALQYYYDWVQEHPNSGLNLNFHCVISPENINLIHDRYYFYNKLQRDVLFNYETLMKILPETKDKLPEYTKEVKKELLKNLLKIGTVYFKQFPYHLYGNKVFNFTLKLINRYDIQKTNSGCGNSFSNTAVIDLNGNLISCQNKGTNQKYGLVSDLLSIYPSQFNKWSDREKCKKCLVLPLCLGGCPLVKLGEENNIDCTERQLWNFSIFLCAWKQIFNSIIIKVIPVNEDFNEI